MGTIQIKKVKKTVTTGKQGEVSEEFALAGNSFTM